MSITKAIGGFFSKLFAFFRSDEAKKIAKKISEAAQDLLPISMELAAAGFKPAAVASVFLQAGVHYLGDLQDGTAIDDVKGVIESSLVSYAKEKWGVNSTQAKVIVNSAYALVQLAQPEQALLPAPAAN